MPEDEVIEPATETPTELETWQTATELRLSTLEQGLAETRDLAASNLAELQTELTSLRDTFLTKTVSPSEPEPVEDIPPVPPVTITPTPAYRRSVF